MTPENRPLPISPPISPRISIVVAHLNDSGGLRKLMASLKAQSFGTDRVEVIVVDNGSRVLPEAEIAGHPNAMLGQEAEPGPGPARNRGVALSRAPLIAFIDSDCEADPEWLARLQARFAADPDLHVLGGEILIRLDTPEPASPQPATPVEAFQLLYAYRQEKLIREQRFSATANMAVRRWVFDAVGPFGGIGITEDTDWGRRAARLGHVTRYDGDVIVFHPARKSMADLRRVWDRQMSQHYFERPEGPAGTLKWIARIPVVALSPLTDLPYVLRSPKVRGARARWLAFRGLVDIRLYRARRMVMMLFDHSTRSANTLWNRR